MQAQCDAVTSSREVGRSQGRAREADSVSPFEFNGIQWDGGAEGYIAGIKSKFFFCRGAFSQRYGGAVGQDAGTKFADDFFDDTAGRQQAGPAGPAGSRRGVKPRHGEIREAWCNGGGVRPCDG